MHKSLPFFIIIAVLVVALCGGLFWWKRSGATPANSSSTFATDVTNAPATANSGQPKPQPADTAGATKPNVKVSSPVVLEEYGDYQCPPCGQLYPELKEIEKEYGNQVQIVFHH